MFTDVRQVPHADSVSFGGMPDVRPGPSRLAAVTARAADAFAALGLVSAAYLGVAPRDLGENAQRAATRLPPRPTPDGHRGATGWAGDDQVVAA